jgi:acetyl-CoA C-acetyltransferase
MVSYPYTKLLVANLPVDMGAAYIMTSFEHATQLGVARESMVFPQCGADANDHWYISERPQLDDSPAMRALWRALENFGLREDTLAHIDLYSCFPTVVQSACDVLGIDAFDPSRIPTLTGGLTFGGGPGNNYVTHAIASAVEALRHDPGSHALVTGLGWFSTKHSWGLYATSPPEKGFQHHDAQSEVDATPKCAFAQLQGNVRIESYTVSHDREGPRRLVACARDARDVRTWCHSEDPALMRIAESEEIIGRPGEVRDGELFF